MEQELGLVKDPTDKQLKDFLKKGRKKSTAKKRLFKDMINKNNNYSDDDTIIEAEILKKSIQIKNN